MKMGKERRQEYLIEKCNEAYEVQNLLVAIKLGLAASGIHRTEFSDLLSLSITKLNYIMTALKNEANVL